MNVIGIIAEFNPFHNGHKYLIDEAKKTTSSDCCIVVMSGSFTQRGEPACASKSARVSAALNSGADAVLELPAAYSTATAEIFAYGGVSALDSLGVVDYLCFGSECADIGLLNAAGQAVSTVSGEKHTGLGAGLKSGLSFPAARAAALPEYADILSNPNDILAVEYTKALDSLNSRILPVAIRRQGSGYLSTDAEGIFPSALAVRKILEEIFATAPKERSDALEQLKSCLPASSFQVIQDSIGVSCPVSENDLWPYLEHSILISDAGSLSVLQDMNPDLANRFINAYTSLISSRSKETKGRNMESFLESMNTKEITLARLRRAALKIILEQKELTRDTDNAPVRCPYVRLLGFKNSARELVHKMSREASIPIITKAADARAMLDASAYETFLQTVRADRLYASIVYNKFKNPVEDTFLTGPLIVGETLI